MRIPNFTSTRYLSQVGTFKEIFAMTRENPNYTGYCLQMKALDTGLIHEIPFNYFGDLEVGLMASYCGTGDGILLNWYGQMGYSSAFPLFESRAPKVVVGGSAVLENGKPALLFDGGNDCLNMTFPYASDEQHFSAVALCAPYVHKNNNFIIGQSTGVKGVTMYSNDTGRSACSARRLGESKHSFYGNAFTEGEAKCIGMKTTRLGTLRTWLNGINVHTIDDTSDTGFSTSPYLTIGASSSYQYAFNGSFQAIGISLANEINNMPSFHELLQQKYKY